MGTNFLLMDSFGRYGSNGLSGGGLAQNVSGAAWFWPDASVCRSLNDLAHINNVRETFVDLFPVSEPSAASSLTTLINNGTIRSSDRIIMEDAGEIPDNSDTYYATWNNVISAANQSGITVKALTTFDTSTTAWQALTDHNSVPIYGSPPTNMKFERTLSAGSHGTGNQCIRDAMTNNGLTATEFAADALWCAQVMRGQTLMRVVQSDWVHPNMWLQWRLVYNINSVCGLASSITNIDPVIARVSANWQALQYNALYWDQTIATNAIKFCLKNTSFP